MNKNPFLNGKKKIADNINLAKKDVVNPFIKEKEKAKSKALKNKRKSILFYQEDYDKIVALSKTEGETIVGLLNSLVENKITQLNEEDNERYNRFLN